MEFATDAQVAGSTGWDQASCCGAGHLLNVATLWNARDADAAIGDCVWSPELAPAGPLFVTNEGSTWGALFPREPSR